MYLFLLLYGYSDTIYTNVAHEQATGRHSTALADAYIEHALP